MAVRRTVRSAIPVPPLANYPKVYLAHVEDEFYIPGQGVAQQKRKRIETREGAWTGWSWIPLWGTRC